MKLEALTPWRKNARKGEKCIQTLRDRPASPARHHTSPPLKKAIEACISALPSAVEIASEVSVSTCLPRDVAAIHSIYSACSALLSAGRKVNRRSLVLWSIEIHRKCKRSPPATTKTGWQVHCTVVWTIGTAVICSWLIDIVPAIYCISIFYRLYSGFLTSWVSFTVRSGLTIY